MSILNDSLLLGADAAGGGTFTRSLRFEANDGNYLQRTPAAAGNRTTWTWAAWVKRSSQTAVEVMFASSNSAGTTYDFFCFSGGIFLFDSAIGGTTFAGVQATQVFRDPAAWYHIVLAFDSTQATNTNRIKLYVNGVQVTAFNSATYPAQNYQVPQLNTIANQTVGRWGDSTANPAYFSGYMTGIHFIDGQALAATSFGEFDTNGVWQPKNYAGTYGTNGFRLDFADNSNTTATTLGKDTSGNGNNYTPFAFTLSGVTNASVTDSPNSPSGQSDSGAGGTVFGNYVTLNPLANAGTLSRGNLRIANATAAYQNSNSTITMPTSGLWYAEATILATTNASSAVTFGLCTSSISLTDSNLGAGSWNIAASSTAGIRANGSNTSVSASAFAAGTVLRLAVDLANNRAWVGAGATWYNSTGGTTGDPSAGTNATFVALPSQLFIRAGVYANTLDVNFGQRPFSFAAPTNFKALCTANLPTPTILRGATLMDTALYTGTGATATPVTSLAFNPDLVWIKNRSTAAAAHYLYDTLRGVFNSLSIDSTSSETLDSSSLTSFNSNGFSVGSSAKVNTSGNTYVAWCWDGGTSTNNTSGSIASTVSANTSAGFSIVTYIGNGTNGATIGHGLGVAPNMIIVRKRNAGDEWTVYHSSLASVSTYLWFHAANTVQAGTNRFGGTSAVAPNSSAFTVGSSTATNHTGFNFVAYCFASVAGYSAIGAYTGNGAADGPFVHTGFRPRFLMIKAANSVADWLIVDTARDPGNASGRYLFPNQTTIEQDFRSVMGVDLLSNGFKIRSSDTQHNANAGTHIYAAFAEHPFKIARAR